MNNLKELEKLKDIKPTLPTNFLADNLTAISLAAAISIIALILIIYFFVFKKQRRKKLSKFEIALNNLKNIDFTATKDAVYNFSENGFIVANKLNKLDEFNKILKSLQKYKYKKQVPKLANEDILKMKNFIKELK
jgi:hypothetical protein